MQKTLLFLVFLLLLTNTTAQKTEFSIALNSGLFTFSGASAEKTTSMNFNNSTTSGYTNNPYGAKFGLGYGVSTNLKRITKDNIVIGLGLGYESLRSKTSIEQVDYYQDTFYFQYPASGQTHLRLNCINFNPQFGYRFYFNKVAFDIIGGFDIVYILNVREKGSAIVDNGTKYTTSLERHTINVDFRPNAQFLAYYRNLGCSIGYAYGFANYRAGYLGGTNECYARLIIFGLAYRLN
jgi:hypothetical protein